MAAQAGSQLFHLLPGILLTPIAARTLEDPKDELGVWAMLLLVSGFASIFSSASLGSFTIRHPRLDAEDISTLFWIASGMGVFAFLLLVAISAPLCEFFGFPEWTAGLIVTGATIVPAAWYGLSSAILSRRKHFATIFWIDFARCTAILALTATLLVFHWGLWSYIYVNLTINVVLAMVGVMLTGGPGTSFRGDLFREAILYSRGLVGFSAINYWARNIDNLLISKYFGPGALGIYSNAYRVMMLPVSLVSGLFGSLLLPYLAPYQANHDVLRLRIIQSVQTVGLISFPLLTMLWLERVTFVTYYLGPDWLEVADLLYVMLPIAMSQSLISPLATCYQLTGKTGLFFWVGLFNTAVIAAGFVVGVGFDLMTLTWIYAGVNVILLPHTVQFVLGTIGGRFLDWLVAVVPLWLIPIASFFVFETIVHIWKPSELQRLAIVPVVVGIITILMASLFLRSSVSFYFHQLLARKSTATDV